MATTTNAVLALGDVKGAGKEVKQHLIINAERISNPSLMTPLPEAIGKSVILADKWVDGKKRTVLAGLKDSDVDPFFPEHSLAKRYITRGLIKVAIINLERKEKAFRLDAFLMFSKKVEELGYLAIQPQVKGELRIYYATPENWCKLFGVSMEVLYASIGKLHKWLHLIATPTKIVVKDDQAIKVLYVHEPDSKLGSPHQDGTIYSNIVLSIKDANGKDTSAFFTYLTQVRTGNPGLNTLIKGLLVSSSYSHFKVKSREVRRRYPHLVKGSYDVILNQHSLKADSTGWREGEIREVKASDLLRIINARLRPGTSTMGRQLVAFPDQAVMRSILEEYGLISNAKKLVELAKGDPESWISCLKGYEKVDTNEFLMLALCIKKGEDWVLPSLFGPLNRRLSFLESEYRNTIASIKVNNQSAYVYTDPRCTEAVDKWLDATGEIASYCVPSSSIRWNDRGEISTIKYPAHSEACFASHKVLREDIFDETSPVIYGIEGGIGLSHQYMRTVPGLDEDGDKMGVWDTAFHLKASIDFSVKEMELKSEPVVISTLAEASALMRSSATSANADAIGIGIIDIAITYGMSYLHSVGYVMPIEISTQIGLLREGGIKGGVKGADGKKGIEDNADLDTQASLERGTLTEDTINWLSSITGINIPYLTNIYSFKKDERVELNIKNNAEIVHALVTKNALCRDNSHSGKFAYRITELLPAYMSHKGDKSHVAWHNAFVILAEGIKPEHMQFSKDDHKIVQGMYKSVLQYTQASFQKYGIELGYSFDLEQVERFAAWLDSFYSSNAKSILRSYYGVKDSETGQVLRQGHWDKLRKADEYQRLNRVIRFMLAGVKPHDVDLKVIPFGNIPSNILSRCSTFAAKTKDSNMYLQCACTIVGAKNINAKGNNGNSGELTRLFPAVPYVNVIELYYKYNQGERNPYLDLAKVRAAEFDAMWLERTMKWLENNPYGEVYTHPDEDSDGFEEYEVASSFEDEE